MLDCPPNGSWRSGSPRQGPQIHPSRSNSLLRVRLRRQWGLALPLRLCLQQGKLSPTPLRSDPYAAAEHHPPSGTPNLRLKRYSPKSFPLEFSSSLQPPGPCLAVVSNSRLATHLQLVLKSLPSAQSAQSKLGPSPSSAGLSNSPLLLPRVEVVSAEYVTPHHHNHHHLMLIR